MTIAPKGGFYDQGLERQATRRRALSNALMQSGKMPETEVVSGVAVQRSPWEYAAKALQTGVGIYQGNKADELEDQAAQRRRDLYRQAMQGYRENPEQTAQMLMGGNEEDIKQGFEILKDLPRENGLFSGDSIDAQMANAMIRQGYAPEQIARMHYSKGVPLQGGGYAVISPEARGLGSPMQQAGQQQHQTAYQPPKYPVSEPQDMASPPSAIETQDLQPLPNVNDINQVINGLTSNGIPQFDPNEPMSPDQIQQAMGGVNGVQQQQSAYDVVIPPMDRAESIDIQNNSALAAQLGVPSVPLNTRGLTGNQQAMLIRRAAEDARNRLESDDMIQARNAAVNNAKDSARWLELQGQQKTGNWQAIPGFRFASGMLDPEFSEMESINARLTPQQRIPGSGASSDLDVRMFQRAVMDVSKPAATNTSIATALKLANERQLEYQDYLARYAEANGTLDGADSRWKQYVEANPIFDPAKTSEFSLNPNAVKFSEFFASGVGQTQTAQPQQSSSGYRVGQRVRFGNEILTYLGGDPELDESWGQ